MSNDNPVLLYHFYEPSIGEHFYVLSSHASPRTILCEQLIKRGSKHKKRNYFRDPNYNWDWLNNQHDTYEDGDVLRIEYSEYDSSPELELL